MPRTDIAILKLKGHIGDAYTASAPTAGDTVNNMQWRFREGDILMVTNPSTGGTLRTMGLHFTPNRNGRRSAEAGGQMRYSLDINQVAVLGPLVADGYIQADGMVYETAAGAEMLFQVLRRS